jgi:hypothetical protein
MSMRAASTPSSGKARRPAYQPVGIKRPALSSIHTWRRQSRSLLGQGDRRRRHAGLVVRPGLGRAFASGTGWVLLLLGLLVLVWRLQVDYLAGHTRAPGRVRMEAHFPRHASKPALAGHHTRAVPAAAPLPTIEDRYSPTAALPIAGGPVLDASLVDRILAAYDSPLRGHGKEIVALSRQYRIDDAVGLAFFVMESRAGTQGEAIVTHSFGNLRPMPHEPAIDGYRAYRTWEDGVAEWFRVMRSLYLDKMALHNVEDVIPVYAPASDLNDPATMVAGIHQLVACWRGYVSVCPEHPASMPALITSAGVHRQ